MWVSFFFFNFSCVSEAKRTVFPPPPPFVLLLMDRRLEELLPPRPPPTTTSSSSPSPPPPPALSPPARRKTRACSRETHLFYFFFTHRAEKDAERTVQRTTPTPQKPPALPGVSTPTRPLTPATYTHTRTRTLTHAQWVEKRRNIGAAAAAAGQRGVFTPKQPHGHPPSAAPSRSPQLCHRDPETPAHTHTHTHL